MQYDSHVKAYNRSQLMEPLTAATIGLGVVQGVQNFGNGLGNLIYGKKILEYNRQQNEWNKKFAQDQFDYQKQINDRNFNFQNEQYQYQKDLNGQIMNREDNAVQRRAADLEQAGLSKTLAAGSSAAASTMSSGSHAGASGSGVSGNAGQISMNPFEVALLKTNIANEIADIRLKNANKGLVDMQSISEGVRSKVLDSEKGKNLANIIFTNLQSEGQRIKNEREGHDRDIDKRRGTKSNETISQKNADVRDVVSTAGEIAGNITESVLPNNPKQSDKELDNLIINMYVNETGSFKVILNKYRDIIPGENDKEKLRYVKRVCNNIRWNY